MSAATDARLAILLPATTYRAHDVLGAAQRLGADVLVVTDKHQVLASALPDKYLQVDFGDVDGVVAALRRAHVRRPFAAVIGLDDETLVPAARCAEALGLTANRPEAVARANDKAAFRQLQRESGLPHPAFAFLDPADPGSGVPADIGYPCVVKPTFLSASRGVLRADDDPSFRSACARIGRLIDRPDVARRAPLAPRMLVERFVVGAEVAVEGLIVEGRVHVLAVFEKPDPLDGPTFAESIYVTPPRLEPAVLDDIGAAVSATCGAAELRWGPIHAELRLADTGPVVLELAPRPIGGQCSRVLRFATGASLEELVLAHAVGPAALPRRDGCAAGVLMLPVPRTGSLARIDGVAAAGEVVGIVETSITVARGDWLEALPEGNRYLGFVFAQATSADAVEEALRAAWSLLDVKFDD